MTKREQRAILAGMVLGDACIRKQKYGINPYIAINHSIKQLEYLRWKMSLLQPMFHYSLIGKERFYKLKKKYKVVFFASRLSPKLKTVWKIAYKNKKKIITRKLLDMLNPLGLAIWYMDDGCCNGKARVVVLSTYCAKQEALQCKRYFNEKWNIDWKIGKHKSGYFLRKGWKSEDMNRFRQLIEPYIIPSMKYKILDITPAIEQTINNCRICGYDTSNTKGGFCFKCQYQRYEIKNPSFRLSMMK